MNVQRWSITSREEWLQWRSLFLGASEVAAACGHDDYQTALQIFAEKSGWVPPQPDNAQLRRGRHFETAALDYLAEEHPDWRIERPNVYVVDTEHRLACTPDAFVYIDGELVNTQVKVVAQPRFQDWDGQPPIGYVIQTLTENLLIDASRGILACLVVSSFNAELKLFDVPRNPAAEARIPRIADSFWQDVGRGRAPAPDYARDGDTLRTILAPVPVDPPVDLGSDNRIMFLLETRGRLKAAVKEAGDELKAIDSEIIAKLDGAERAVAGGFKLTWREEHVKAYQVAERTQRVLRVTAPKEKAA